MDSEFADYREMVEAGMVERGWVPEFVPESAVRIRERHDLDTNEIWLRFDFSPGDLETMVSSCDPTSRTKVPPPRFGPFDIVAWWPIGLRTSPPSEQFEYFRCVRHRSIGFLAVDADTERAYYWEL